MLKQILQTPMSNKIFSVGVDEASTHSLSTPVRYRVYTNDARISPQGANCVLWNHVSLTITLAVVRPFWQRTQTYHHRCSKSRNSRSSSRKKKSSFHYTQGITPKRVTSCGAHLRGLAHGQHSFEETSQR